MAESKSGGEVMLIGCGAVALLLGVAAFASLWWIGPTYRVWEQRKAGEARLAEAESSRKIAVAEAEAKLEAATMLAQAEVERAKGVAEANKILGESLKGNEEYLRYLWIENLDRGNNAVIYVPTEAGLPILEAGRTPAVPAPPQ
jgi:regulator of protease activity HflC (stomatin/prohibitin superfamily)